MARLFDMAKMTVSGTPSTGTFTLASAALGFQTFADAGAQDGDVVFYSAKGLAGWEVGQGTIGDTITTLTRGPTSSSNSNAAVDFGSDVIVEISALSKSFIQSITLDGNTAGTSAPIISPTLDFAGGNNITLSGTSNTISIIGPVTVAQSVQTLGLFAVGNTTGTTSSQTRDARTLSFDGAGIASVGFSAGSIIISASTAATNPLLSIFAVGNTTSDASSGVIAAGSLSFDGAGIVSVGVAGSSIVISAPSPAASGTVQNRFAGGNSFGQSSSAVGTLSSLNVSATGGISAGFSTDASSGVLMLSVAPPVASGVVGNYFASGNTTAISSSSTHTLSNISISGAGIVSVGVSTTGAGAGILVVSAPSPAASQGSLSLFAVGNTTVSSSTSSALPEALSLSGAGIITVGYSSNTILLSATVAASGATQNQYAIGNTTAASSSTTQTLSSVSISGAGIVSVGYSTTAAGAGALVISASTAATNPLLSLFAVGNTTTSVSSGLNQAGSLSFDGAGIVSVGISGSSVVISAPATGTVGNYFASGNTTAISSSSTHTLSAISISGAGIVSVGVSTTGAAAGILVVSASTAATNPLLSLFAVGNTTSSVSSGVNAAGSLSFDGAGIVSVGISNSSIVVSAPSPNLSLFAVGNTTGASSSTSSVLPEALSFSGAGVASVGYSSNTIIISAPAAANALISLFAVGNTTSSVSSGVQGQNSLSFDGAGIVSVGISNSSIVISASTAATNPVVSIFAVGNTTSSVSSGVIAAGSMSFDAAGALSVGVSNSSVVLSSPDVSTLSGVSGITTTTGGSTISIGEQVVSFLEPRPWLQTTTTTWALGTMAVEPFVVNRPLTINQANFFSSRAVAAPLMTFSSSTASRTATASATWGSTASLVIYSQQDATSFGTFSSTTASFGMSAVLSGSYSSSSKTFSQTVTFGWPQGTSAAVTSSMSTTFSHVSSTAASQVMHTSSSLFTNILRNDYPFAASFPPGNYLAGIMWSSASGSSTLSTGLMTLSAPTWLASNGVITQLGTFVVAVPGAAISNPFPGVGSTSSAASAVPGTIAWSSLSSTVSHPVNYFYLNQG
jgi:trimeric autotransporter adhesin